MSTQPSIAAPGIEPETRLSLEIPMLKMLTSKEELSLALTAYTRAPESHELRHRLAAQLLAADRFDEVIALLEERKDLSSRTLNLLSSALLARETHLDDERALVIAEHAVQLSQDQKERALTVTELAKVVTRLGDLQRAEELLQQALNLQPSEKDAYKRLFQLKLQRSREEALVFAQDTIAAGVCHSRVLGSAPLALALLGRIDEARAAEGSHQFAASFDPEPPPGWDSLKQFNDALTAEALNHPDARFNRYGVASAQTWRLDEPALQRTKCFQQLQKLIQRETERYARTLPDTGHPWLQAMPQSAVLRNWTVIVEGDGYETWHVHQNGWMSGVYYIHVQDHIAQGSGNGGCIAFGLPDAVVGADAAAAFGETLVRPHSGLMMLFPSHIFHRTYPHHGSGRRICYAFDIIPSREL
ncbi:2OG-Fe(II) oxygenase family protein [Granulicella tundricola]|uniref:Uncharacterized protein n=1 Tax=Granulicella tundricola (strain ATCC BAA-1859 / DSM 23138 / MP5ACTX9) TaxID=1198114 RepID=E8X105_GRATM|nr:putative 2OG-Fe(II) oxygenase [Granulicella tundricola]ADW67871.1 hypothetical protein AciX9_0803 [Granulicella tundricola MP5ACTX9]